MSSSRIALCTTIARPTSTTSTSLCHVPPSVAAPHGLHLLAAAASPGSRRDVVAPHPCSLYYSSHRRASPCHGVRASNRDPTTTRDLPHLPPARHQHSGPHFRAMAETPEAVAARDCQDRGPVIDHVGPNRMQRPRAGACSISQALPLLVYM